MGDKISAKILIIDDDDSFCVVTSNLLRLDGHFVEYRVDVYAGFDYLKQHPEVDLVLLDIDLGAEISGIEAISEILAIGPAFQIVMLTSQRGLETGIESMKQGAYDYMTKPFRREDLVRILPGALERKKLRLLNSLYLEMLVHDLKNPLQSINMGIDILADDQASMDASIKERAKILLKYGSWQIQNMISNILNVSKFEKYAFPLNLESFALEEAVKPHIQALVDRIQFTGKEFEIRFPAKKNFRVKTDKLLFVEVISNLICNAIRFTKKGDKITVVCEKAPGGFLKVEISNTGSYIEEEYRGKIFDKFFKSQYKDQKQTSNFGLGLTFSKLAVEALGGDIRVESTKSPVAERTTFLFTVKNHK